MADVNDVRQPVQGLEKSTARGRGLPPVRRIYRNYAWVVILAGVLFGLWALYTWNNYRSYQQKDYFSELTLIEQLGVSMMVDEGAEQYPAYERWLIGAEDGEVSRRRAVRHLVYADEEGLIGHDGLVMLACVYWSLGDEDNARIISEQVSGVDSYEAAILLDLLNGKELADDERSYLRHGLIRYPRNWVLCFLADKTAESHSEDEGREFRELAAERREVWVLLFAKIAIIGWIVFIAGLVCLLKLVRSSRAGSGESRGGPRVAGLWPLALVMIVFCVGDVVADISTELLWLLAPVFGASPDSPGFLSNISDVLYQMFADIVFRFTGAALFLWFFLRRVRHAWRTFLQPVACVWLWCLAGYFVVIACDLLLYSLPESWFAFDSTLGFQWSGYGLLPSLLSAVVLAPIGEELVFRGLLFNGLKNRLGLHVGAVVSAVMFAAVHFYGVQDLIAVGIFGVVMAYVYHATRSLRVCILIHALYNLVITLSNWLIYNSPGKYWELG